MRMYISIWLLLMSSMVLGQEELFIDYDAFRLSSIYPLPVLNTEHMEFSPTIYRDGIVFLGSQEISDRYDKRINESFFDLKYYNESSGQAPRIFSDVMNSNYHMGPCSFTNNGTRVYYSETKINRRSRKKNQMRLVIKDFIDGTWTEIDEFPHNSNNYSVFHPAISENDSLLIFASNMDGGYGGIDLYKSVKESDGSWSFPVNLGPLINTDGNDLFPGLYKDKWLLYSSNGREGFGDLDIFVSKKEGEAWGFPENIGEPINSGFDDFGFTILPSDDVGYYTSSKPGGEGKDDIYKVVFHQPILKDASVFNKPTELVDFLFTIQDGFTDVPLGNASIKYYPLAVGSENESTRIRNAQPDSASSVVIKTDYEGQSVVTLEKNTNYIVFVEKEGYQVVQRTIDASVAVDEFRVSLNKIPEEEKVEVVVVDPPKETTKVIVQSPPTSAPPTKTTTPATTPTRIPPTPTSKPNVTPPSRTPTVVDRRPTVVAAPVAASVEAPEESSAVLRVKSLRDIRNLQRNEPAVIDKLDYAVGRAEIQATASRELDKIAEVLYGNEDIRIRLAAYTDAQGTEEDNLLLSEKRAHSARNYLLLLGIEESRIEAIGMGEDNLLNGCSDGVKCTSEQHAQNRRIEVTILSK